MIGLANTQVHFAPADKTKGRIASREGERRAAETAVLQLLRDENATWLIEGKTPPHDADTAIRRLLDKIEESGNAELRRLKRNFFIRTMEDARRAGHWSGPIPAQTLRAPLPRPPITETSFPHIALTGTLRSTFLDALRDPQFPALDRVLAIRRFGHAKARPTSRDLEAGCALLSAVLFGGVTRTSHLEAIARAPAERLQRHDNCIWIDWLQSAEPRTSDARWQRWYPEQISGFLVARAHRNNCFPLARTPGNVTIKEAIWKSIDAILAILPLTPENRPPSLPKLMAWAKTWTYYQLPPFLAAYACGRIESASRVPDAHLRMLARRPAALSGSVPAEYVAVDSPLRPGRHDLAPGSATGNLAVLRRELRSAISASREKHVAVRALARYLERHDLTPAFVRLSEWARSLCDHHTRGSARRRLSSIYEYVSRIDLPLAVALEARDPVALTASEFEALYSEILEGLGPRRASRAIHPLMLFHRYLVSAYGVPDDLGRVFDGYTRAGSVDAAMVSEYEYLAAMERLDADRSGEHAWLAEMQQIALMLGYRGKLRRGEVHRLRIGDVCGGVFGVLYVRSTDQGQVKSVAGTRKFQMEGQFPAAELSRLRDFVVSRLRRLVGNDDIHRILAPFDEESERIRTRALFEQPDIAGRLVPERTLFDPVVRTLMEVTRDPDSHFHRLRKGGQNDLFAALMEEELPGCSRQFDPGGSIARESELVHRSLLGNRGPDRRKLWAVAAVAGHASPATTTGSYLLGLDWLLSYALQKCSPQIDGKLLSALTGLTQNNIRVLRSTRKIEPDNWAHWVAHGHRRWWTGLATTGALPDASPGPTGLTQPSAGPPPLPGADALCMIHDAKENGADVDAIARRYGMRPEVAMAWVELARNLACLEGRSPAQRRKCEFVDHHDAVGGHGITINRRLSVFPPLRQRDERRRLNRWTVALHEHAMRAPGTMAAWFETFWRNRRARSHEVGFRSTGTARAFLDTLTILAKEDMAAIGYRLVPVSGAHSPSADEQRRAWSAALDIAVDEIAVLNPVARQQDGDRIGTLAIFLHHEQVLSKETLRERGKGIAPQASWQKNESLALEAACYVVSLWMLAGLYDPRNGAPSPTDRDH